MKNYTNETSEIKYTIAYNGDKSVIHVNELQPNQQISTGQPNLDIYDTKEELGTAHGQVAVDMLNPEIEEMGE